MLRINMNKNLTKKKKEKDSSYFLRLFFLVFWGRH
jgi:hypothetical protein